MRFNSVVFWVFLASACIALWALPQRARKPWLLVASYVFYGLWHPVYLGLMVGVASVASFGGGWVIAAEDAHKKRRGTIVISALLLVLGIFKYLDWTVSNVNALSVILARPAWRLPLPRWMLPLGISFYVFEAVSYVVECVRKKEKKYSFWDFQLFIAFFPHLIAGPIMRAKELIPQFEPSRWKLKAEDLSEGLWLIGTGLALKILIGDNLASQVDVHFARDPSTLGSKDVVVLAISFGLQIYFDFSAYSRLAIGSARFCGVKLVQNFNHPFSARTPADFWNRWHMSLSRWIRDYLFFPLVGRRLTVANMCKASIIAMTLCGVWHGAGWTFVLWGVYHGLLSAAYYVGRSLTRRTDAEGRPQSNFFDTRPGAIFAMGLTWLGLLPTWILFRAPTVEQASQLLKVMLTPWAHPMRNLGGKFYLHVTFLMFATWAAPLVSRWSKQIGDRLASSSNGAPALSAMRGVAVGCMIVSAVIYLDSQTSFIYFQF